MTTGEKLKKILGLDGFKYVVFERILVFPVKAITIYYNSRRPNLPLTNDLLHKRFHFASIRRPPYSENLPVTPIMPIEMYNSGSDPSVIFIVDIGGDLTDPENQIPRKLESKEEVYFPRLDEWVTLAALKNTASIDAFTKKHRDIRNQAVGTENLTAKLINCVYNEQQDCLTFIFKTTATTPIYPKNAKYKKVNPTLDFSLSNNPDKVYYSHIRILEFMKWLKDTRPDNLADQPITWKEIKDVLEVAYVQVWDSCPAFHWQGSNYWLSQLDGSIFPTDIEPKVWNAPHLHGDGQNFLCKHLYGIIRQISFFGNQMASMASKELKRLNKI